MKTKRVFYCHKCGKTYLRLKIPRKCIECGRKGTMKRILTEEDLK